MWPKICENLFHQTDHEIKINLLDLFFLRFSSLSSFFLNLQDLQELCFAVQEFGRNKGNTRKEKESSSVMMWKIEMKFMETPVW